MWIGTATLNELNAAARWTVAYFSAETISQDSAFPLVPLKKCVREKKASTDPHSLDCEFINYLGLENIRQNTGELVDFRPRSPCEIKSRSKIFDPGDVLYGRLRPELNKVYLVEPGVGPGICSTEFIVLEPDTTKVSPRYLRHILASPFVKQFAQKLRSGASLPRMNASDLLDLAIPVPPLTYQEELASELERLDNTLREIRQKVESLPNEVCSSLMESVRTSSNALSHLC